MPPLISWTFLSFPLIVFLSWIVLYPPPNNDAVDTDVHLLLSELNLHSSSSPSPLLRNQPPRIALGYNTNVDLITNGISLLERFETSPETTWSGRLFDHSTISNLSSALEFFSFFLQRGSAAERFVEDASLFRALVAQAEAMDHGSRYALGGNAGLMSLQLAIQGAEVVLGGKVGSKLKGLLHPSVIVPNMTTISPQDDDEIHLVLEFEIGQEWHGLRVNRSNRVILVADKTNANVQMAEPFHHALQQSISDSPLDAMVVAGLHLLAPMDPEFRAERLDAVVSLLQRLRRQTTPTSPPLAIHFELASVGTLEYMEELGRFIVPRADSIGLNEQELGALYLSMGGKTYPSLDQFTQPTMDVIEHALTFVFERCGGNTLSRIHFHSLDVHVVAHRTCDGCRVWQRGLEAASAGSLKATTKACHDPGEQVDPKRVRMGTTVNSVHREGEAPSFVRSYTKQRIEFNVAPVLICKKPRGTVGLGDAISATGLIRQL